MKKIIVILFLTLSLTSWSQSTNDVGKVTYPSPRIVHYGEHVYFFPFADKEFGQNLAKFTLVNKRLIEVVSVCPNIVTVNRQIERDYKQGYKTKWDEPNAFKNDYSLPNGYWVICKEKSPLSK